MRTINNPLDRQTRNDINYNFSTLESDLSDGIENINEKLDDALDGRQLEELFDAATDARKEAESARNQSAYANEKGKYADEKGTYANEQGDYAKAQGNYAKEKAEYASAKTAEIEQAHTDLSQIKVDAVDATQKANTQADYAKKMGDYAKTAGENVDGKMVDIDDAISLAIQKGQEAEQQGLIAKEQGDYAQSVIDSYKHVGDWQGSVEYKKNQEVLYNGSTYRAIEDNKGTQPTDKSVWQLIAQRGVDGEGSVSSVNNILPDETGNIDLGDLSNKEYIHSLMKDSTTLDSSNYIATSKAVHDIGVSLGNTNKVVIGLDGDLKSHIGTIANRVNTGHVKVGMSLKVNDSGVIDIDEEQFPTKKYVEEGLKYLKEDIQVHSNLMASKEVLGHVKIGEGLSIDSDGMLSVTGGGASSKEINYTGDLDSSVPATEIPIGVFVSNAGGGYPVAQGTVLTSRGINTFQIFSGDGMGGNRSKIYFRQWYNGKWGDWKTVIDSSSVGISSTKATGKNSTALGNSTKAIGSESFALGYITSAEGGQSIAGGVDSSARGSGSIAIGSNCEAVGLQSNARGTNSRATQGHSTAIGNNCEALGISSFVHGSESKVMKHYAITVGYSLEGYEGATFGKYNAIRDISDLFTVGNGSANGRSNAIRVTNTGNVHVQGRYNTSGADYAEMFEWEDGNIENEDRVGLAVTWGSGEYIKLANEGDEVIGIVSATAAILGDNPDEWHNRFVTDQFGRLLRKEYTEINEDGKEETYEWFVENPEYDKDTPYVSRSERPEWSAIGLMGKLYWIDDGTLEVGDYATVGSNGVATKGDKSNGWRVMKRISKNVDGNSGVVKVFFK